MDIERITAPLRVISWSLRKGGINLGDMLIQDMHDGSSRMKSDWPPQWHQNLFYSLECPHLRLN